MNDKTIKSESTLAWLKYLLIEKLWFILLLTPLLIIAVIIVQNLQFTKKQSGHQGMVMAAGAVEISAVELASIVAKPFSELLTMDVYPNSNRYRSASFASLSNKKASFQHEAYKRSYERQPEGYQSVKLVSYEIFSSNKKEKISASDDFVI